MVKIRLTRAGAKKRPFYRIIAIDERKARDGRPLEFLGTYDPNQPDAPTTIKMAELDAWVAKGAQMSDTVRSLVRKVKRTPTAATTPTSTTTPATETPAVAGEAS